MKVTRHNFTLFPSQSINHKKRLGKKKKTHTNLREKQTRAILRWFQSCLIVHEDLQNQQKKSENKSKSVKFLLQPILNVS